MINLRKLRREAVRVLYQIVSTPKVIFEYFFATPWHDGVLRQRQVQTPGNIAFSEKIAIYLIYPRYGVMETHLESLRYLVSRGYSPVTVSNLFLGQQEREKIAELSYLLIERDNFGYDFGGYREGIIKIAGDLSKLNRLVFINDSCWFPLPGSNDWLSLAENCGLDYVAAASNFGIDAPDIERFSELVWHYDNTRSSFHYCSFALSLSSRVICDPNFVRFWRSYKMSNRKSRTVRRGEIGLTQWAINQGYSHGSVFNVDKLDHNLCTLDYNRLRKIANDLIIPENVSLNQKIEELLSQKNSIEINRERLIKLILTAVASQGMAYSISQYLIESQGYTFLKKSPVRLDIKACQKTLAIIDRLGTAGKHLKAEADEMIKQRKHNR